MYKYPSIPLLILVAAWVTHIVFTLTHGLYILLLAGALVVPVGVIHGVMIWMGMGLG